jgi:site-specific DNA-methyltransferase (adenine-specific)
MINYFYKDEINDLYLIKGDSIKILPLLLDEFPGKFHGIISDPPYNIEYRSNHRKQDDFMGQRIANDDSMEVIEKSVPLITELMKDDSVFYFFAHPNMIGENRQIIDKYLTYKNTLVWAKGEGGTFGDLTGAYSLNWEAILFYNKGRRELNSPRPRCILDVGNWSARSNPVHPCSKPVKLFNKILSHSTNEGDWILDPFMGSGPLAEACKFMKRKFVGIELEECYLKEAVKRLQQGNLF